MASAELDGTVGARPPRQAAAPPVAAPPRARAAHKFAASVVPVLAEYLEAVSAAVLKHCSTIDKFLGDGVMAFWGAPVPSEGHAADACAAALECQTLLSLQRAAAERCGGTALRMRIGINTGRMLVGNIGSSERLNYTVIGDPVNIASRLEPLGKIYGVEIVIGEETRIAAGDAIIVRRLDRVSVYDRVGGIAIYELLGMVEHFGAEAPEWVRSYEAGLAAYENRCWSEAIKLLETVAAARGAIDRPSEILWNDAAPISPTHRPTVGHRFQCANRNDLRSSCANRS